MDVNYVKGGGKSRCDGGQGTGKSRFWMVSDLIRDENRHREEDTEPCAGLKACTLLLLLS